MTSGVCLSRVWSVVLVVILCLGTTGCNTLVALRAPGQGASNGSPDRTANGVTTDSTDVSRTDGRHTAMDSSSSAEVRQSRPPESARGAGERGPSSSEDHYDPSTYAPHRGLIDIKHFCQGKRRAAVIIDPSNPQRVRGCLRLPYGYDGLANLLNDRTTIRAEVDRSLDETGQDLFTRPFIGAPGKLNRDEALRLVEYLRSGGLLLGGMSEELKRSLVRAEFVERIDYWAESLQSDHPVFHSYFDLTAETDGGNRTSRLGLQTVGYFMGDRLIAISGVPGNERGRINSVIYALTRPGALAHQYIRGITEP